MTKEYRAKVFKSGNSVALRLPKALGLEAGTEMVVREEHGQFRFEPADKPKRMFNIAKVAGSATNLRRIEREDRLFEERPLRWGKPAKDDEA